MALDNGYHLARQNLPTTADTAYECHSMDVSKQSSPREPLSLSLDCPPGPYPSSELWSPKQQEITDDGGVDGGPAHESRILNRNNLGISLVAQIHSLKKELGGKDRMIEDLEESLHKSRADNEQYTQDLKIQKVEVTSIQKQMQSLEKDLLQALEDIARERDNAVESIADTRQRLEDSKKKLRAQEGDADKACALWEKDKENWNNKRRKMEGRVHLVEERLKTMVAEMLNVQNRDQKSSGMGDDVDEGIEGTWFSKGNDLSSNQATSRLSNRNLDESYESKGISPFRSSRMSGLHGLGGSQMSGLSLAEELELGECEDATECEESDQNALPEETYPSMRRYSEDKKARKVMGFHTETYEEPFGDETSVQHSIGTINDYIDISGKQLEIHYTDTGTQFSLPSSPLLETQERGVMEKRIEQTEPTANQRRKRIAIPLISAEQTPDLKAASPTALSMVSTGSQTIEQYEDRASTAEATNESSVPVTSTAIGMKYASTQTNEDYIPIMKPVTSRLSPSPMDVPVIAIHPPASRPSLSRTSVMLPPRTKNAACQVMVELLGNTKSASMQTEETKIDKRPVRIPPRLASYEIPTQPPPRFAERRKQAGKISISESSKRSRQSPPPIRAEEIQPDVTTAGIKHAYPGNNDNGPLNYRQRSGPRRPIRSESIFAGFDVASDNDPERAQDYFSDDEFLTAAPIRKTLSKVQNSWKLVPQLEESLLENLKSASEEMEDGKHVSAPKAATAKAKVSSQTISKKIQTRSVESHRIARSYVKQPDIRRKAIISNGIVEHAQRGRSPSKSGIFGTEATIPPPFPVPTRYSSRKVPPSASDGAASPSPQTTTFSSASHAHGGQKYDRPPIKRKILRKVQSATAVTQSPVPLRPRPIKSLSASSTVPPSPKSPPSRRNQFVLPYSNVAELPSHSVPPQTGARGSLMDTSSEQTSVVDAVAQTMVGEWMWKYIRKRTSFGITENPQTEFDNGNGSGVRHKRWVWLAPFERAVIWSNKQPTSGPALLGKGGRKLTIQSVLDVKDDAPLPKNADPQALFDRSILILTPQRALKFTATSKERHYVWLAALSYLSHSTREMDDVASPLPPPIHEQQYLNFHEPMNVFRRTAVRDSIGTARVKKRPSLGAHSYSSPVGLMEQEIIEGARLPWEDEEAESDDAAEPPQVHRVAAHGSKSGSTGPRAVPLSAFRNYANNAMALASTSSLQGPTPREKYDGYTPRPPVGSGAHTTHSTLTRSNTESNVAPSPVVPDNFFECAGTVRMEAFVDGKEQDYVPNTRREKHQTRQGHKKDMSFWGFDGSAGGNGWASARLKGEDPFTEF